MAITVPTLDAPRVSGQSLPVIPERTNYSPQEFGSSVVANAAFDVAGVAQRLEPVLAEAKKKADGHVVEAALNTLREQNDAGFEQVRRAEGTNAMYEANKFYDEADKRAKKIYASLTNDQQRLAFTAHANAELTQAHRMAETHVGQQLQVANDQEFKAGFQSSMRRVTDVGVDQPEVLNNEIVAMERRARDYASQHGLGPEATQALVDQQTGTAYLAAARVLVARKRFDDASSVLAQHAGIIGPEGTALLAAVERERVHAQADDAAKALLDATGGDLIRAEAEADRRPAGVERDQLKDAIRARGELMMQGKHINDIRHWDTALGLYQAQSDSETRRSWRALRRDHPLEWAALTPDQQHNIQQREDAARREADGLPMTRAQQEAWLRLWGDIETRRQFWGSSPESELTNNRDFNILPTRVQNQLIGQVAQAHVDHTNPTAMLRGAESVIKAQAVKNGLLNPNKITGDPSTWKDEDSRNAFVGLLDHVANAQAEWLSQHKGERIPNAVYEGFVDDYRKTRIPGTIWDSKYTPEEAALLPPEKRSQLLPVASSSEEAIGSMVQQRRGITKESNPEAYSPQALIDAAKEWRATRTPPSARETAAITQWLKENGKKVTPEAIQAKREWDALHYQQ